MLGFALLSMARGGASDGLGPKGFNGTIGFPTEHVFAPNLGSARTWFSSSVFSLPPSPSPSPHPPLGRPSRPLSCGIQTIEEVDYYDGRGTWGIAAERNWLGMLAPDFLDGRLASHQTYLTQDPPRYPARETRDAIALV